MSEGERAALSQMVQERAALEEEKAQIEAQATWDKRSFLVNRQRMEKTLLDLRANIRLKQELIVDLQQTKQEASAVRAEYQAQLLEKEQQLSSKQRELEAFVADFDAKSADARHSLRTRYEAKVESLRTQIGVMQQEQKAHAKGVRAQRISEQQVTNMQGEIARMKQQEGALRLRLREEGDRYEVQRARQEQELGVLRRDSQSQAEAFAKRIRQLEAENRQQRTKLRRMQQQQQQRLRSPARRSGQGGGQGGGRGDGGASGARPATAPSGGGGGAGELRYAGGGGGGGGGGGVPADAQRVLAERQALLDAEVEAQLVREEASARLELELRQREEALREKESALAARHALELRRMRNSQLMGEERAELERHLEQLSAQQLRLTQQQPPAGGDGGQTLGQLQQQQQAGAGAEAEIKEAGEAAAAAAVLAALRQQQAAAYARRAELEAQAEARQFLSKEDEEQLFELEDRIGE
jgi:hypothetical protein